MTWELTNEHNWGLVLCHIETGQSFYVDGKTAMHVAINGDEYKPCPYCVDGTDPKRKHPACPYCMGVRIYPRLGMHQDFNRYTMDPKNPLLPEEDGFEYNCPNFTRLRSD